MSKKTTYPMPTLHLLIDFPKKAANDAKFNGGGDYTPPYRPMVGRGGLIWT